MKDLGVESIPDRGRVLNAVALQNAVLLLNVMLSAIAPMINVWSAAAIRFST